MTSLLTAEQTRTIGTLLSERETSLATEIAEAQGSARERIDPGAREVTDRKDDARDEAAVEVADAELERDLAELKAVQAARLRLAAGVYGRCLDCDEPIAFQRLLAQPAAVRCTQCQAGYEHHHAIS